MTVLGFVLYGSLVLLPVMLQTLFGYSSLEAGQGDGAARHRLADHDADRRHAHRRSSTRESCSSSGLTIGGVTMLWLGELNLNAGLLGHLLAAVPAGRRHGAALRAAHHRVDGDDSRPSAWATRPACST